MAKRGARLAAVTQLGEFLRFSQAPGGDLWQMQAEVIIDDPRGIFGTPELFIKRLERRPSTYGSTS